MRPRPLMALSLILSVLPMLSPRAAGDPYAAMRKYIDQTCLKTDIGPYKQANKDKYLAKPDGSIGIIHDFTYNGRWNGNTKVLDLTPDPNNPNKFGFVSVSGSTQAAIAGDDPAHIQVEITNPGLGTLTYDCSKS